MELHELGPFVMRKDLLILIIAGMAGYYMMGARLKKTRLYDALIMNQVFDAMMIILLFWKFGDVFIDPLIVWNDPFKLLRMQGTYSAMGVGAVFAFVYLSYKFRKTPRTIWSIADLIPYGILTAAIIINAFTWKYGSLTRWPWGISANDPRYHYHPLNVYLLTLSVLLFIRLWNLTYIPGTGKGIRDFLSLFGLGLLTISIMKPHDGSFLYFSIEQWIYLGMIIAGVLLSVKKPA